MQRDAPPRRFRDPPDEAANGARFTANGEPNDKGRAERDEGTYEGALRPHVIGLAELRAIPEPEPVIGGLLDLDSLAFLYGRPGTGKSFVALDMALSIATGTRWDRRLVERGPVLFVAAEAPSTLARRVDAWKERRAVYNDPDTFLVLPLVVNLLSFQHAGEMADICADLHPHLVVFDTFARCTPGGDENSSSDMGKAIAALDGIRASSGACVLVVHHTGKDAERGARGWSGLEGAADSMLQITKDADVVTITTKKMKNRAEPNPIRLTAVPTAGSLALEPYTGIMSDDYSPAELTALAALATIEVPGGVSMTSWTAAAAEAGVSEATVMRARRKGLDNCHAELDSSSTPKARRYVLTDAGRCHLQEQGK